MAPFPSAILFDMDGVLVRSFEPWFRTLQDAGARFRGRSVTREEFEPTFGQGTKADVERFGFDCTPAELDRFYAETFPRYADAVWVDPHAAKVLEAVAARGLGRALVTNTVSELTRTILTAAKLWHLFDAVACADQVERPKPAPDVVNRALEQLGAAPRQAWMVGDSRYDREAARSAGVFFVGLRLEGDARLESLEDLERLLGSAG